MRKRKRRQREQYLEERRQERELIDQYMTDGVIKLSELAKVEPFIRKVLLGWIGKSMASKDRKVKTDYGLVVKVTMDTNHMILLEAEDGTLKMPDAVFEVQEQEAGKDESRSNVRI